MKSVVEHHQFSLLNIIYLQTKRDTLFEFFKNLLLNLNYLFKKCKIDSVINGVNLLEVKILRNSKMNSQFKNISDRDLLVSIYEEMVSLRDTIRYIPNFISMVDVADFHNLSYKQMYRRVVESGDFEEDTHYKRVNGEVRVSKSILHLLKRKRKPKGVSL